MFFKIDAKFIEERDDYLEQLCKGRKVLHIGACDWPYTTEKFQNGLLLHEKITKVASEVLGVDISEEAIQTMRDLGYNNILYFDINRIGELDFAPDIIVLGETIEHIMNLENALTNIKKIMSGDAELLISTPNAFYISNFLNAFRKRESANEDHKLYLSAQTLKQLLESNNLHVLEIGFAFLNRKSETLKKKLLKKLIRYFPMLAETIIARCRLEGA